MIEPAISRWDRLVARVHEDAAARRLTEADVDAAVAEIRSKRDGDEPAAAAVALAEEIASFAEVVPLMADSGSWVVDKDDDPVVEAALMGRATHLVTGDARIHEVAVDGVRVVTPAEALAVLEAGQRGETTSAD